MKWLQTALNKRKQRVEAARERRVAELWERAKNEASLLYQLIQRSNNAKTFVAACARQGYQVLGEDGLGITILTQEGKLIVSVMASHHPSKIFCLVYKPAHLNHTICLVDEGVVIAAKSLKQQHGLDV